MARDFFTMDDFDLSGRTVLLRVDINSPVDPATGQLLNDARIREHMTTIRELRHSKTVMLAHQSRPGRDDFTTLEAHAERIGALLGRPVRYVSSLFGRPAIEAVEAMHPGDVVVLENTRFYAEEESLADAKLDKMAKTHIVRRGRQLVPRCVGDRPRRAHPRFHAPRGRRLRPAPRRMQGAASKIFAANPRPHGRGLERQRRAPASDGLGAAREVPRVRHRP